MQDSHSLIFDLGGVVFDWTASVTQPSVDPKLLKRILASATWGQYERGVLTDASCFNQIAQKFNVEADQVSDAIVQARASLQCNVGVVDFLRQMKPTHKIFAMSNMSLPDWEFVQQLAFPWELFDQVFISAVAGERKPDIGFYHYVFRETGVDPRETVFVDDTLDNVIAAKALGMIAFHFEKSRQNDIFKMIRNMSRDAVKDGKDFLKRNSGSHWSVSSKGEMIRERFSQLLLYEATGDRSLIHHPVCPCIVGFMTDGSAADDVDTTSIMLTIIGDDFDEKTKEEAMDKILSCRNSDGIVQVYFDKERPRVDPIVCVNALTLFHKYGRGADLDATFNWVETILETEAYESGTRYYPEVEAFLFLLARLMPFLPLDAEMRLLPAFRRGILRRVGTDTDVLGRAMRVIAASYVGIKDAQSIECLKHLQDEDGGWPAGCAYRYAMKATSIGNRGLTTCLAINAINAVTSLESHIPYSPPIVLPSPGKILDDDGSKPPNDAAQRIHSILVWPSLAEYATASWARESFRQLFRVS